jgi:hypothetical protein
MGSAIEINDTLQITLEQGFPGDLLNRQRHVERPVTVQELAGRDFGFVGKPNARIFQLAPVRVYWVHNIDGKWLFWGKIAIVEQTISQVILDGQAWQDGAWQTAGRYRVLEIYDPAYQELFTRREAPLGKSFF